MKEIIVQIFFIVIEWSIFYDCMFTWFEFEESHSSFEYEEWHSSFQYEEWHSSFKYEESHSSFEYEESHSSRASRQHFSLFWFTFHNVRSCLLHFFSSIFFIFSFFIFFISFSFSSHFFFFFISFLFFFHHSINFQDDNIKSMHILIHSSSIYHWWYSFKIKKTRKISKTKDKKMINDSNFHVKFFRNEFKTIAYLKYITVKNFRKLRFHSSSLF
jgi:hypothetical protein